MSTADRITGANIARLRTARGWSKHELARRIGHSNGGALSQYETGKRHAGPVLLTRLAAVLGIEVNALTSTYGPLAQRKARPGTPADT